MPTENGNPDRKIFRALLVLSILTLFGLLFAQVYRHGSLPEPLVELTGESVTVPFTITGGRPIVPLRINGAGPYPFILDSGAEGTMLTKALADELKLPVIGSALAASPGAKNPAVATLVRLSRLELGGVRISDGTGVALDLSSMPKVFSGPGAPMGALSIRAWKGLLVTINYPTSRVEIRRGALPAPNNADILEFSASDRVPSVAVELAGVPLRANLDSGAARGIVLPRSFESRLPLAAAPVPTESLRTVSGEQAATIATLKGALKIGTHSVEAPDVNFVDEFPMGNLGYPVLQHFALTFDWQNHRVQLR